MNTMRLIGSSARAVLAALLLVAAFTSAGCGTVAGAGQDIQDAGEAVENTANKVKKKI